MDGYSSTLRPILCINLFGSALPTQFANQHPLFAVLQGPGGCTRAYRVHAPAAIAAQAVGRVYISPDSYLADLVVGGGLPQGCMADDTTGWPCTLAAGMNIIYPGGTQGSIVGLTPGSEV